MYYLYPVPPQSTVTQTFAEHVAQALLNNWTNYNGGIDWYVVLGTRVRAAQAGTVAGVRTDATGYGTHIRIVHAGGSVTIYAHLQKSLVAVGQKVIAGEVIGLSGSTGFSTGPHLHFELRVNGKPTDPAPLLRVSLNTPTEAPAEAPEPVFATLPRVMIVSSDGLRVRSEPSTTSTIVTVLSYGTEVEVIRRVAVDWLQIGHNQFIAKQYDGEILAVWK